MRKRFATTAISGAMALQLGVASCSSDMVVVRRRDSGKPGTAAPSLTCEPGAASGSGAVRFQPVHAPAAGLATAPQVLSRMVSLLAEHRDVCGIIVEGTQTLSVTVFARALSEEVRDAVYTAELTVLDETAAPLSFHLRTAPLVGDEMLELPFVVHQWRRAGGHAEHG